MILRGMKDLLLRLIELGLVEFSSSLRFIIFFIMSRDDLVLCHCYKPNINSINA